MAKYYVFLEREGISRKEKISMRFFLKRKTTKGLESSLVFLLVLATVPADPVAGFLFTIFDSWLIKTIHAKEKFQSDLPLFPPWPQKPT
jgi:hypothetical protein